MIVHVACRMFIHARVRDTYSSSKLLSVQFDRLWNSLLVIHSHWPQDGLIQNASRRSCHSSLDICAIQHSHHCAWRFHHRQPSTFDLKGRMSFLLTNLGMLESTALAEAGRWWHQSRSSDEFCRYAQSRWVRIHIQCKTWRSRGFSCYRYCEG